MIRADRDDAEADRLRDEMDDLWPSLNEEDSARIRLLSADLNWLTETLARDDDGPIDKTTIGRIFQAEDEGNWPEFHHRVITSTAELGKIHSLSFMATYWALRGDFESGLVFIDAMMVERENQIAILDSQPRDSENWHETMSETSRDSEAGFLVSDKLASTREDRDKAHQSLDRQRARVEKLHGLTEFLAKVSASSEPHPVVASALRQTFFEIGRDLTSSAA